MTPNPEDRPWARDFAASQVSIALYFGVVPGGIVLPDVPDRHSSSFCSRSPACGNFA
jgi:hypothetical protein